MVQGFSNINPLNIRGTQDSVNSFGNIQRAGMTPNGRAVYRVIDSNGQEAGKLTVPAGHADTFEKAYIDIMETAPKIQKYAAENSSEKDIKKRRNLSRLIVGTCGVIGAGIPIYLTRKSSTLKQILCTVVGIVAGLSAGFAASLAATTPPGTYKFARATRTLSKLDIQPLMENSENRV